MSQFKSDINRLRFLIHKRLKFICVFMLFLSCDRLCIYLWSGHMVMYCAHTMHHPGGIVPWIMLLHFTLYLTVEFHCMNWAPTKYQLLFQLVLIYGFIWLNIIVDNMNTLKLQIGFPALYFMCTQYLELRSLRSKRLNLENNMSCWLSLWQK